VGDALLMYFSRKASALAVIIDMLVVNSV